MKVAFMLLSSLLWLGCGANAQLSSSKPLPSTTKTDENRNLQTLQLDCQIDLSSLKGFYARVPDDFRDVRKDTGLIERLRKCPKDEVIATLSSLLNSNKSDYEVEIKATYLFVKLDHNKAQSKRRLMDLFNAYPYKKIETLAIQPDRVIDMVSDVIFYDGDTKEFLSDAFDLKTDGASSAILYGNLASVFEKTPDMFLRELGKKSKSKRESVYSGLCTEISKNRLFDQIGKIDQTSDVYLASQEMLAFVDKTTVCRNF